MFKTILTNILSIHKPKDDNSIMVKIKLSRKRISRNKKVTWWADIDWHVFRLPDHDQSIIINDIKIKAEIVE